MADRKKRVPEDQGAHQTNLAEGEPDIIEESIRIHERKKDAQGPRVKKAGGA